MTATNMCSYFGSKWSSLPKTIVSFSSRVHKIFRVLSVIRMYGRNIYIYLHKTKYGLLSVIRTYGRNIYMYLHATKHGLLSVIRMYGRYINIYIYLHATKHGLLSVIRTYGRYIYICTYIQPNTGYSPL